ncbi:large ribosomal subunit protein eL6 [Lepeophtheirus salmonis]|nr:60S ribosomal protein L6-like [Lepeophtheirus salmonis]
MAKNKNVGKPRNYKLASGVVRFGKSKMYHKKAIYKFLKKTTPKKVEASKPAFVEKKVGGAKNGGTRMVRVKKLKNDFPTMERRAHRIAKKPEKLSRRVRPTLTPGTIAVILAGIHKGKRIVILKELSSGMLLISGPFKLNNCPIRRINQRYLLATSTKLDVSSIKMPENINDDYFRRLRAAKKPAGSVFEGKKEEYKPSEQRKKDQVEVDKQLLNVIMKHPEASLLKQYLKKSFGLSKGQYPHNMKF